MPRAPLPIGGVGAGVPIRVCGCENGWPTRPDRGEQHRAEVLDRVSGVHARAGELGATHRELFTLRDAVSSTDDLFDNFGVLRDDYSPKPAYERLAALCAELA